MSLVVTHASLATVNEMFRYRSEGFSLPPFPPFVDYEWGVKAHNRPWIAATGRWKPGQRVIELGGAYSRLPEWLGDNFGVEPWVGDSYGAGLGESEMWSRYGDPRELPKQYPSVTYRFEDFGPGSSYDSDFFDCVFSVSTLEHIPPDKRLDVMRDVHRTLAPGGTELHAIDVPVPAPRRALAASVAERTPGGRQLLASRHPDSICGWWQLLKESGVDTSRVSPPSSLGLLDRSTLVETPDVVYRFWPPEDAPSDYKPTASLLVVIEDL